MLQLLDRLLKKKDFEKEFLFFILLFYLYMIDDCAYKERKKRLHNNG